MPRSNYGKWSFGSAIAMFVLLISGTALSKHLDNIAFTGDTINTHIFGNYITQLLLQFGFTAGITALICGLISIFNQKDRGGLIIISTIFGAAATLYFIVVLIF